MMEKLTIEALIKQKKELENEGQSFSGDVTELEALERESIIFDSVKGVFLVGSVPYFVFSLWGVTDDTIKIAGRYALNKVYRQIDHLYNKHTKQ